mgnify:CR=1 FL=1
MGTPAYMSPEQATAGEVSEGTDVWSLDYELIDSTCDYGYWEPEEECVTDEDGMTTCTWSVKTTPDKEPSTMSSAIWK